ncbi:MAG: hypothetical protein AABM67_04925 [Acidobacteriota bacterium]
MHNCKANRERLIEAAMTSTPSDQSAIELELRGCPACLAEFESVRSSLRITDQAMQATAPAESFWAGYNSRLRQSLERDAATRSQSRNRAAFRISLRNLFDSHLRVPVPVALVLIAVFGLTVFFAGRSQRAPLSSSPPSVITRTIEVPVVQERLVTQIVYRDRIRVPQDRSRQAFANTARRRNATSDSNPASLSGFKPANEARLTIIKGSYQNDK